MTGTTTTNTTPSIKGKAKPKNIAQRTLMYWNLSLVWNGRYSGQKVTVEKALNVTRELVCTTDPNRPLIKRVLDIEHEIIVGRNNRKSKKES